MSLKLLERVPSLVGARSSVTLTLPDGAAVTVPAGGLVGQGTLATLRIEDPRIREAHALVTRRGTHLVLIALRGTLRVGRSLVPALTLEVGQQIELGAGFVVQVTDLQAPPTGLALATLAAAPVPLEGEVATVYVEPLRLETGYDPEGLAHVTSTGDGWVAHAGGQVHALHEGARFEVAGHTVRVVAVALDDDRPLPDRGVPLRLVARLPTVHIHREGCDPVVLTGMSAKIVCGLVHHGRPVSWEVLAASLFGSIARRSARMRWDRNLQTLRRKLREGGIHQDLVVSDGHGHVDLVLAPWDTVVDDR